MVIKLKDDFIPLYLLKQYSNYGLPDDYAQQVALGNIKMTQQQIQMAQHFKTLEQSILVDKNDGPRLNKVILDDL